VKWALLLLPLLLFGLAFFSRRSQTTPEQEFWKWFQSNEPSLFDFEKNQERIFDRILKELHRVNPDLTFEFGPKLNGRREFVISADGIKTAFPKVESLYASAPSLPRWTFIKFRQRRAPSDVNYGGVSVKTTSVLVQLQPAGSKADVVIFIPGYTSAAYPTYAPIVFLLLDQALGEYDVEMHVGKIEIRPVSEAPAGALSLDALPKVFDDSFVKK